MIRVGRWSVVAVWLWGAAGLAAAGGPVTTESLLEELADLGRLAELSEPAYTVRQFSSTDRKSKRPDDPAGWFANADRGHYLRVEDREGRREYVMMDAAGPGAIVRIWSANPEGRLRIYLDDGAEPVLAAGMKELLSGEVPGLPRPLAGVRARGYNLYFPIPYAGACKVTCEDPALFYHVGVRTFAAGVEVASFSRPELERLGKKIRRLADRLSKPREAGAPGGRGETRDWKVSVPPGQSAAIAEYPGPGLIAEFRVVLSAPDAASAAAGVVLEMEFDGERTVSCPLGDFFGSAPGLNAFESLPCGVTGGDRPEMWSHWRMPFARSARLGVRNLASQTVELSGAVVVEPAVWTDRSLLFHAKWRIQRELPARPMIDWTHLECGGAGRFVGSVLHVVNPVRDWWGEGDEKIYIDGDTFPSFFGTGTEDYYGYAWGSGERFSHAYHNQVRCDGPGHYGHTCVSRFHVLDDIPFSRRLRFDMENWPWNAKAVMARSAVSFWYARPGGTDFFGPIAPADVVPVHVAPYVVHREPGAIEGEDLKVIEHSGRVSVQELGPGWSGEKHLWWTGAEPGGRLVLGFTWPEAGVRRVVVRLTRAGDYGQVRLAVNGRRAGGVFDGFDPQVSPADEMDLGPCELVAGENHLEVEMVGSNPKARPAYMFGLDYLKVP